MLLLLWFSLVVMEMSKPACSRRTPRAWAIGYVPFFAPSVMLLFDEYASMRFERGSCVMLFSSDMLSANRFIVDSYESYWLSCGCDAA